MWQLREGERPVMVGENGNISQGSKNTVASNIAFVLLFSCDPAHRNRTSFFTAVCLLLQLQKLNIPEAKTTDIACHIYDNITFKTITVKEIIFIHAYGTQTNLLLWQQFVEKFKDLCKIPLFFNKLNQLCGNVKLSSH